MKRFARIASGAGIVLAGGLIAISIAGAQGIGSPVGTSVTVVGNGYMTLGAPTTTATSTVVTGTSTAVTATSSIMVGTTTVTVPVIQTGTGTAILTPGASVAVTQNQVNCPVVTSFMKPGAANRQSDVIKLQTFLKNVEGLNVDVTGTYDLQTEAAVAAFQTKYKNDILGPWGASIPSGMVYITTAKKINQIACGTQLSLSSSDLGVLSDFKAKKASGVQFGTTAITGTGATGASVTVGGSALDQARGQLTPGTVTSATGTIGTSTASDDDEDDFDYAAAVAEAGDSMAKRFWVYVTGWFR